MAAELHDVPMVVGDLFPMIMLSEYDPISSMPYLGRRGNRLLIRLVKSRLFDRCCVAGDSGISASDSACRPRTGT